ncbi:MAG: alanine racemase, partial [Chloroflexi bacterium]|nr:alanine racemase [Chloroflexota bacterium]
EAPERYRRIRAIDGLEVDGAMTHYANADVEADTFTAEQARRFCAFLGAIGEPPRLVHAAASAGIAIGADASFTAVRPGLALYGLHPEPFLEAALDLRPALGWSSRIHRLASVPAGTGVGYTHPYRTEREARIATVPVGYGDGLQRSAREAEVLIRGRRARIAKRVAMDMFMVDVTDIPAAAEGDEVVLIGAQGSDRIAAEDLARSCGTINYEIVTALRRRLTRRYRSAGRVVATRTLADGVVWS